jgi:hypothetical protein
MSGSLLAVHESETWLKPGVAVSPVGAAGATVSAGTGTRAVRSSIEMRIGPLLSVELVNERSAIPPAVCGPVASVVVKFHADGSSVPSAHTLTRIVVGFAPLTCVRIQIAWFAACVSPATATSAVPMSVSAGAVREARTNTWPFGAKRILPRYSMLPAWRTAT